MKEDMKSYQTLVNGYLQEALPKPVGEFKLLYEAMRYSLEAGGKRIRPILMQLAYEAVGGKEDISRYLCAIEMIHTYSLIHDDLPAMDNDDLRRGRPTNHIVFGEATAILAGDGLLNEAFEYMLEDAISHGGIERVRAIHILSQASGTKGMIAGQILDMTSENQVISFETLETIHRYKTGALITAATKMGAVLGLGSKSEIDALEAYGQYIGKVFQIIDDVLDEVSTDKVLGKPVKSDEKNHKNTYLSFYSVEESCQIAERLTAKALEVLKRVKGNTDLLAEIAVSLAKRTN
ncbi:MAG: Farnesyltranstransferase [Clostridia bacterium]|nr:Farnesyltranstransferase [Clostridia bacterium]